MTQKIGGAAAGSGGGEEKHEHFPLLEEVAEGLDKRSTGSHFAVLCDGHR